MAVGDLKRKIVAEFSAENKAKGVIGGFRKDLDLTGRTMRRMATGALTLAGVGGMGYLLKQTMTSIDKMSKMSYELQISTEALAGLEHAAKISGTSIESLHKGMEIFVRRMGEAKFGVGEGVRGLEMLGMTAEEIISMGTERGFMEIAQRISEAGTAAEQAGIAYNFFGRQGVQLLNMFQQGKVGIQEMREEARKLGLTFTEFDASKVWAANDAITRARAVITGLARQATIELAPYIEMLATKFVDVSTAGEGMGENVTTVFEMMAQGAVKVGSFIQMLGVRQKQLSATVVEGLGRYFEILEKIDFIPAFKGMEYLFERQYGKSFGEFGKELRDSAKEWKTELADLEKETKARTTSIERFFDDLRKKAETRRVELEKQAKKRMAAGTAPEIGLPDLGAMEEHWKKVSARAGTYQEMQDRMARQRWETQVQATWQIMEAEEKAAKELEELWAERDRAREENAISAMRERFMEGRRLEEEAAERSKRIAEDIGLSMARSWTNALDRMMFEGQKFWESMKSMARSLIREIANIMLYRTVSEPFATRLMAGVGELFSGHGPLASAPVRPPGQTVFAYPGMESYQHGGIATETGPAYIHAGEKITAPGEVVASSVVHIHNEGQEKLELSRTEEYILGDERIIHVTMKAMQTDINYQRAIARAAR